MKLALWRFKFLGLLVLAFLIFIPTLVFSEGTTETGYRIYKNVTSPGIYPAGHSVTCISNTSGNDYFIPTKTSGEFNSFEANLPTGASVVPCCDSSPAGVYRAAQYYKDSWCGVYPGCHLMPPWFSGDADVEGSLGGSCGLFQKWRNTRCASFVAATTMCQGQPCVTAAVRQSDWTKIRFCYGTYDYSLKKCMYTGSTLEGIGTDYGYVTINMTTTGYEISWMPHWAGVAASWGTCSSAAPCGDLICSTAYGETCGSCPYDCGVCPCGNSVCDPGETCSSCPGDCGSCPCSDYYNQSDCTLAGCYWHSYGYVCGNYPCSYYYDYECASVGCIWDSYNYYCVNSCSEIYDQYACGSAGCLWDYSYYYCY